MEIKVGCAGAGSNVVVRIERIIEFRVDIRPVYAGRYC